MSFVVPSFDVSSDIQGDQMQKDMSIDTMPVAVAYEVKAAMDRRRSASVQSNRSADSFDLDMDMEIVVNDLEVPDSPPVSLRKKLIP
jgi:hypothetical protein